MIKVCVLLQILISPYLKFGCEFVFKMYDGIESSMLQDHQLMKRKMSFWFLTLFHLSNWTLNWE